MNTGLSGGRGAIGAAYRGGGAVAAMTSDGDVATSSMPARRRPRGVAWLLQRPPGGRGALAKWYQIYLAWASLHCSALCCLFPLLLVRGAPILAITH